MDDGIRVEVAYATAARQLSIETTVPRGATLQDAIEASGILQQFPEIDLNHAKVGVFGKVATLSAVVSAHDRVEIYRPLAADPRQARRQRAKKGVKP